MIDKKELENLFEEIRKNAEKSDEIIKSFKLFKTMFSEDDGIPPKFGSNFRDEGPKWEKVTGLDFEAIGRILVCHLIIEHYINNLIELSTPREFNWDRSRMTFSQKIKLIDKIPILKNNKFNKGIEILNSIRNNFSHDMLASFDENKVEQLKNILLDYLCRKKGKEEKEEIISHINQFGTHAIIERFTSISCALIAGYCTSLINKQADGETYYKYIRSSNGV